jgi:hypothetical protein
MICAKYKRNTFVIGLVLGSVVVFSFPVLGILAGLGGLKVCIGKNNK